MVTVYNYKTSTITLSKGENKEVISFNCGDVDCPHEAIILLKFREGKLSLQEAYHLLKYDPKLYFL